jgi:hypothetical protein
VDEVSKRSFRNEEGQNLVLLAGAMLLLIAILAIAIDVGNMYLIRRKMQNAADSGALAGAQYLCHDLSPTAGGAEAIALEYAVDKNSADAGLTTADADMGDYTVTVNAVESTPHYAAQILGIGPTNVPAVAVAACGPANGGCGLWPIGFDKTLWDDLSGRCPTSSTFYLWAAYHEDASLKSECRACCEDPAGQTGCDALRPPCDCEADWDKKAPDCELCNCEDPRGGGAEDIVLFTDVGRAWLDFSSQAERENIYPVNCDPRTGCGANELSCWITDNFNGYVTIGDGICIDGDSGVKAGVKDEIDSRAGDIVQIPVFDGRCEEERCAEGFNVVKLGCIQVQGWEHNVRLDYRVPPGPGNPTCWKGKLIRVSVVCDGCTNTCAGTAGGGPPGDGEAGGISLLQ